MDTYYQFEKENVRNAFIFCLYTGMRFCDVKDLRYSNIDYANKLLRFEQDKTKGHSARSWFAVNILNNGANIKTVDSLLGHSGLKHVEKYTRAVDKLKEDAINSLPALNL